MQCLEPDKHFIIAAEQPAPLQETTGWATITQLSRSSPGTLLMVPLCNMAISWPSNTPTVATIDGCTAQAPTTTHKAAALPTNIHAQLQTRTLVSRSSRSCETLKFQVKLYFTV